MTGIHSPADRRHAFCIATRLRLTLDTNKVEKGGHFAVWEQPQLFSEEIRAGFRSLRN
jgi:pimeloyl-ACP methyl ester carboxylesterase